LKKFDRNQMQSVALTLLVSNAPGQEQKRPVRLSPENGKKELDIVLQ